MNIDIKQIFTLLGQWLIAVIVLAWEQAFSLPFLFFALSIIFVRLQPRYYREGLLLLLGLSFAALYNLWLGVGVVWVFALLGMSFAIGRFLPALRVRVLVSSLLGSALLALLTGQELTTSRLVIIGLLTIGFWVISMFVRWDVRNVAVSKANWGWQKV